MLASDRWHDQSNEKYCAFVVSCFDIREIPQRVGGVISKLPPLSIGQWWWAGIPDSSRFALKGSHHTLRIENNVTTAAQEGHHPATILRLFFEVAPHLEGWIDQRLDLDAFDDKIPALAIWTIDHNNNVDIAMWADRIREPPTSTPSSSLPNSDFSRSTASSMMA